MSRFRKSIGQRVTVAALALLSLMLASNHCVVLGMLVTSNGATSSCHAVAEAKPASPSCCHPESSGAKVPIGSMPCCSVSVPPTLVKVLHLEAPGQTIAVVTPTEEPLSEPKPSWVGKDRQTIGPPQSLLARAPLSSRAPPSA